MQKYITITWISDQFDVVVCNTTQGEWRAPARSASLVSDLIFIS